MRRYRPIVWPTVGIALCMALAVGAPIVSASPAVRGCTSDCLYSTPFPSGSAFTKVVPTTPTGSGVNKYVTPLSSVGGGVWLSSLSEAGGAVGSNSAGTASQEVEAGFEVLGGSIWPTGTWEQDYWFYVTATPEGSNGLGGGTVSCPPSGSGSSYAWIEVGANMYDATTGKFVYAADQMSAPSGMPYSVGCNNGWSQSVSNMTLVNDIIYPSLTSGHTYYWYFYLGIYTKVSCSAGGGTSSWIDVQHNGNWGLTGGIYYWY